MSLLELHKMRCIHYEVTGSGTGGRFVNGIDLVSRLVTAACCGRQGRTDDRDGIFSVRLAFAFYLVY